MQLRWQWTLRPTNSKNMSERVRRLLKDCLRTKKELWKEEWIHVYSVHRERYSILGSFTTSRNAQFSKKKLKLHRAEIASLLRRLPWSPSGLNELTISEAAFDIDGKRWVNPHGSMFPYGHVHDDVEMLFLLGMGAGLVEKRLQRANWTDGVENSVPFRLLDFSILF